MTELVLTTFSNALPEAIATIIQVAIGYILLCLIVPWICLHAFVAHKNLAVRITIYQVSGLLYITFAGFGLAFVNMYNTASVWLTHIALPLVVAAAFPYRAACIAWIRKAVARSQSISHDYISWRLVATRMRQDIASRGSTLYHTYLAGHVITYIGWLFLGLFLLCFLGYFRLNTIAYSCSDDSTHMFWTRALLLGNPFPAGLYPHAEHFLAASICALFNITPARCWLVLNTLTNFLIYWMSYLFLRETFASRAAAFGAIGICTTSNLLHLSTSSRLILSVPMEFALFATFASFLGLVHFLRDKDRLSLALFGAGLALALEIHFYVAIFTLVLILAFAVVFAIPALRAKTFHKIFLATIVSLVVGITPFAAGYAIGFQLEPSIGWALSVMGIKFDQNDMSFTAIEESDEEKEPDGNELAIQQRLEETSQPLDYLEIIPFFLTLFYFSADEDTGSVVQFVLLFDLLYSVLGIAWCLARRRGSPIVYQTMLALTLSWLFGLFLVVSPSFGLPTIIQTNRVVSFLAIWLVPVMCIPLQAGYNVLRLIAKSPNHLDTLATSAVLGALLVNLQTGAFTRDPNQFMYSLVTPEGDVRTCVDLVEKREPFTWTLISPVSDLGAIRYSGYHYETIDLLYAIEQGETDLYIPTPDVFIYTETQVPDMQTGRFVNGSDYAEKLTPVSAEAASASFSKLAEEGFIMGSHRVYYGFREEIMSRLYYWMKKLQLVYPMETTIYYQDDSVCVYHIKQDPYFPLNLAVPFDDLIEADLAAAEP